MKPKKIIIITVVVVGAGLGILALKKSSGSAAGSAPDEAAAPPTLVSVQVGVLKPATLHRYVTGYGMVEPALATADEPAAGATLAAPVAGVVATVNVVAGQQVKKGETLVELNSGALTFALAAQMLARQQALFDQHNTSLKMLQDAGAQLDSLCVSAPLSGTVTRLNVKPGQAVDLTTVVAEVMDLSRLAVRTDIPASEAGALQPGQPVQVLVDPPVTATLSFVSQVVDTNNNTVLVRAALPADSGLRPGQFAPLQIVTAVHMNCLAAPEPSVVTDINGQSVIAQVNGDEAVQIPVQTGFRENGWVEINGMGLKAGDSVVTVGAYGLPEKTKVQILK